MKKAIAALLTLVLYLGTAAGENAAIPGNSFPDFTVTAASGKPFIPVAFPERDYTRTAVLTDVPPDTSTLAFPVYKRRSVRIENENVKKILVYTDQEEEPAEVYIVPDSTAYLRLELAAGDNPDQIIYYDALEGCYTMNDLLDPERGGFVYDQPLPDGSDGNHMTGGLMLVSEYGTDALAFTECIIVTGEEYIEEFIRMLEGAGYTGIRQEYAGVTAREENALQAYTIHVADQYNDPVPEVTVNFCTNVACVLRESDENGTLTFNGTPDVYHVQIVDVPDGYSYDGDFELYTSGMYSEWTLRIRKD